MQIAEQSDTERIYNLIKGRSLDPGTLYTKSELSEALGRPVENCRQALYRAIRWLERDEKRTLTCVTGVGYRIAHANETPKIAAVRRQRMRKQGELAQHTIRHTDRTLLNSEERQELDRNAAAILALQQEHRRIDKRLKNLEDRVDEQEKQPRLTPEEIRQFRNLLSVQGPRR